MSSVEILEECVTLPGTVTALVKKAAETAFRSEGKEPDVTVLLTTEERIRKLNSTFRGINKVTDVLSFPSTEGPDGYAGDIAICARRAFDQAEEYGHSAEREFAFLTVHGCLHLLGYDHIDPADEEKMLAKQREILKEMDLHR